MRINYFVAPRTYDFTDAETRGAAIAAIYRLANELGVSLTENHKEDTVMCDGKEIACGTWIGCGCYYHRWLVITNQPEKIVQAAIRAGVGKKRIKAAYRKFCEEFPPLLDKWAHNFHHGNVPADWVSEI